jgi:hypothetical protein
MQLPTRRITTYTFFGLLERTFAVYRENFTTIFGIVALVMIPITLLQYLISPAQATGNVQEALRTSSNGSQLLVNILNLIQTIFVYGPLSYVTSEALFGQRATIGAAFAAMRNRFGKLGCGFILLGLIAVLLVVGLVLLFSVFAAPALALIGLLLFILIAASAMLVPVLTLENIGPFSGIPRAYGLGKQRFWTALGLSLLIGLMTLLVALLVGVITALLLLAAGGQNALNAPQSPLIFAIGVLVAALFVPLTPIAATILYYDIRVRSESLDTILESSTPETRPINLSSPDAPIGFTRSDVRNIVILMVISLVLGLLLNNVVQLFLEQFNEIMRQRA